MIHIHYADEYSLRENDVIRAVYNNCNVECVSSGR